MNSSGFGSQGSGNPPKLDSQATLGLAGTVDSLAYRIEEIEHHFHSENQCYGATSASVPTMVRDSLVPITVTAGDAAWGSELILHPGSVIESGSSTMKFDLHTLRVSSVGTANRMAIYEFFAFSAGTPKVAAAVAATNKITDATNSVADNDKIYFPTIASNTGIVVYEVYFVRARAAGDFEVSLTRGGGAVDITGADGACSYVSLGASDADGRALTLQPRVTAFNISRANGNTDTFPTEIRMGRQFCNRLISCRGKAAAGGNTIAFHVNLHSYPG